MKTTVISELMTRLNEIRREKESLMNRMHHFTINYSGWMDTEDGLKARAEYTRLTSLDHHYSMTILDMQKA